MTAHETPERLSSFIDDDLSAAEAAEVEAHLAQCPDCRAQVDRLRRAVLALRSLPPVAAPPDLVRNVRRRVRRRGSRKLRTRAQGLHQELLTGAAIAMLVGVVVLSGRAVQLGPEAQALPEELTDVTGREATAVRAVRVRFDVTDADAARTFVDGAADLGAQLARPHAEGGEPLPPGTPIPDEGLLLLVPEPALSFIVPEGIAHLDVMASPGSLRDDEAQVVGVLPRGWVLVRVVVR